MLRSTIARKVLRLRSIRSSRSVHSYDHPSPTHPLPILTELPPSAGPSRSFPLYQRPPPSEYIPLTKETLASLPSDESLSRQMKVNLTRKAIRDLPELQEDDLKKFYKDLVKSGLKSRDEDVLAISSPEEIRKLPFSPEERREVLEVLETRLLGSSEHSLPGSSDQGVSEGSTHLVEGRDVPNHIKVLGVLAELAQPDIQGPSGTSKSPAAGASGVEVPLGVISGKEWKALFEEFTARKDARGAEGLLDVMTLHGVTVEEDRIAEIMRIDAKAGRVEDVGRLTMELVQSGLEIKDSHKDLLILSLLRRSPSQPTIAITQLLSAEAAGQPFPQSSYQVVISHLTRPSQLMQPNSHTRAMAWDLFTQMRFAAHPTPTRELYTTMIRTCAEATQPEPERARDLWIEMTESEKMEPTRDEYSAIIRALGSTKKDYLEAFDLLRQMLAKHHDATFVPFEDPDQAMPRFSEYVPNLETFTALLEGTKRAGDLNRARWVLTESVKLARTGRMLGAREWQEGVDEDLLSGVFMTYAAWKPVVRRHVVKLKDGDTRAQTVNDADAADDAAAASVDGSDGQEAWLDVNVLEELVDSPSTRAERQEGVPTKADDQSEVPATPLSSADAIREADALFQRILHDTQATPSADQPYLPFKDVRLSPRLINSFISVHLAHAPSLASAREAYETAWSAAQELAGPRPNGWTYLQILEKCSGGNRSGVTRSDRDTAFAWGQEAWAQYRAWSAAATEELDRIVEPSIRARQKWLAGLGDRQIERVWRAAIRLFALHGDTSEAMSILAEFHTSYPPSDILDTFSTIPEVGFKVRMSSASSVPEAQVPPYLTFEDLDILHSRLVKEEKLKDVARVKFFVSGYEAKLAQRRKWRLKGFRQGKELAKFREAEKRLRDRSGEIEWATIGEEEEEFEHEYERRTAQNYGRR